ncbi:YfcE family phosphodiesterase [Microbacterium sp.]|uniref:metallophosphoesterase family protein n=1 Tax=Microbacterium sp. TaxID=51671 RepID=UPI00281122DF|nr:YfcE family phosphodiesterase [Microbacterium sp.]
MTTRLLLLADTHVPRRARHLPDDVLIAAGAADIVVHAGDWVDEATLDLLEQHSAVLHGVHGNNDGAAVRARLPEVERFRVEDVEVAVVHETGPAKGRELRGDAAFPGIDLLVFGHSHIPWDTRSPLGMRLVNPGSPTDRRRQPQCTMMLATIDEDAVGIELCTVNRAR